MQFPEFFNPAEGIVRKLQENMNHLAPQLFDILLDMVQLNVIKQSMIVDEGLTQSDTLNGCDSLGHLVSMHETLELPIAEMTISVFGCGCLLGIIGGDEFIGFMCHDHISRLQNIPLSEVSDDMRRPAINALIQKWINANGSHIRDHHEEWQKSFIKVDGTRYDWSAAFNPEQKKHDDIARDLLNE